MIRQRHVVNGQHFLHQVNVIRSAEEKKGVYNEKTKLIVTTNEIRLLFLQNLIQMVVDNGAKAFEDLHANLAEQLDGRIVSLEHCNEGGV